jgi:hypothetical protein
MAAPTTEQYKQHGTMNRGKKTNNNIPVTSRLSDHQQGAKKEETKR